MKLPMLHKMSILRHKVYVRIVSRHKPTDLIESGSGSGSETLGKAKHMKIALFEKKITDWIEKTETIKSNV